MNTAIAPRQYYAYIAHSGYVIVQRYLGEHDRQEARRNLKDEIGVFPAADLVAARRIALALRGTR